MGRHRRRRALPQGWRVVVATVAITALSSTAFAYWASVGRGGGSGTTSNAAVLTVTSNAATAALYPGSTAAVYTKLTNSGAAAIRVSSIALATAEGTAGFDVDASHSDCGTDSLTFTTQTNGGSGWTVPPNSSLNVTLSGALAMATSADDECQGATFTVHLRVAS